MVILSGTTRFGSRLEPAPITSFISSDVRRSFFVFSTPFTLSPIATSSISPPESISSTTGELISNSPASAATSIAVAFISSAALAAPTKIIDSNIMPTIINLFNFKASPFNWINTQIDLNINNMYTNI